MKTIQANQASAKWDYINTTENLADLLSWGLTAEQLKDNSLWWERPNFLTQNANPFTEEIKFKKSKVQPLEATQARKTLVC